MKQYKLVASLFVSASLLSTTTLAHDVYKGEAMPIATSTSHNWTGFYAGLNSGVVRHTMNITDTQATTFNASIQQVTNPDLTGGFQVGYRYQMDMNKISGLYGVELSANFSNAGSNKDYGSPFALYQLHSENNLKEIYLLQLIGGITADKTLLFLAAGFSCANITGNVTNQAGIPFFNSFSLSKKAFGTSVGGGIEYAFNEKVSMRFKVDVITPNTYNTADNVGDNFQISNNIVLSAIGLNYKFG